jgi:hypothetical protein
MLNGTLKRLVVMVALTGWFGATSDRIAAAPAGAAPAPARVSGGAVPAADHAPARRRRPPVEEGCRELPAPAPQAPAPPATCS